jgi:hypothetical protein
MSTTPDVYNWSSFKVGVALILQQKRHSGNEYTRNDRTAGHVIFCVVRVVSRRELIT